MEQEKRRPGATNGDGSTTASSAAQADAGAGKSQEHNGVMDAAKQFRPKKVKKSKSANGGVKVKSGKKLKVSAIGSLVVPAGSTSGGGKEAFGRKLTPKKRWIQLWSAQIDTDEGAVSDGTPEAPSGEDKDPGVVLVSDAGSNEETAPVAAEAKAAVPEVSKTPAAQISAPLVAVAAKKKSAEAKRSPEKPVAVPTSAPVTEQLVKAVSATSKPTEVVETTVQVKQNGETPRAVAAVTTPAAATVSIELRVKTPQNAESSHLSPPLERNSPSTAASISPSAKVKESDPPSSGTTAGSAKFSPSTASSEKPVPTENAQPKKNSIPPALEKRDSSSSLEKAGAETRTESTGRHRDRGRKRSLERSSEAPPLSEEAKRRAERRRKRKSNWDLGDPRHGGSPVANMDGVAPSAAAAAANQQSFAKFPPGRPTWRHSQSMMDMKPHFQNGSYRSSFHNNGPMPTSGRRGFYHSTSMPLDRSRSTGRSSSRYGSGNHR
ncbi:hypothetical protein BBJ28_00009413 [Nothophytophthora sp. Chile5]|nr:hypothetical protein BBJ28_00009413 [Nothophytophthora sp. Chile5]